MSGKRFHYLQNNTVFTLTPLYYKQKCLTIKSLMSYDRPTVPFNRRSVVSLKTYEQENCYTKLKGTPRVVVL